MIVIMTEPWFGTLAWSPNTRTITVHTRYPDEIKLRVAIEEGCKRITAPFAVRFNDEVIDAGGCVPTTGD